MDVLVRKWMASAVLGAAMLVGSAETLSAQAAPAGGGQAAPASPPIVVYRKALMNANVQHMAALRALSSGELELPDQVRKHAAALRENAVLTLKNNGGIHDLFPPGSLHATSRATAKIWDEPEEFTWRALAFQETASALFEVARGGGSAAQIRDAVGKVQVTCGGCHASMRGPAPPAGTN